MKLLLSSGLSLLVLACGSSSTSNGATANDAAAADAVATDTAAAAPAESGMGGDAFRPESGVPEGSQTDGGSGDGGGATDATLGSECHCDPGTQYCLHGDVTTNGQMNVERCEPLIGDGCDCSCYLQVGLCLEQGLPEACTTVGGVIVVECAEIP